MRELMRDAGLKEPVFEMDAFFQATFYRDPRYSLKVKKVGENAEKMRRGVGEKVGANTEKVRSKYGENAEKIILAISGNQFIKTYEMAEKTNLSQSTIEKIVAKLKKAGLLKRIGPDKGGHWEIVDG
jgi:ATP-dependent DNA helicase RecG